MATQEPSPPSTSPLPNPIVTLPQCLIRPYSEADVPALAHEANSPLIARNMRNTFPSPYTGAEARSWVQHARAAAPMLDFALCLPDGGGGVLAGGIGLKLRDDVESRTAEIGYWLGRAHWGRGIAAAAVAAFSRWAFAADRRLLRLEACVFGHNPASARVLDKAGYVLEGVRRSAGSKDGAVFDILMYGLLREECMGVEDGNEDCS